MNKNDVALNFDTAEYYNLQEACDYLNRKHKIDNLIPKKLLKQISSRNFNTFIHFRMDNLSNKPLRIQVESYESNVFSDNIYNLAQDELIPFIEKINKVEESISSSLVDELYMGFILFKVDEYTLFNMSLNSNMDNATQLLLSDGFVHKLSINDDPSKPSQLNEWSVDIDGKQYYFEEIGGLSFVVDSIKHKDLVEFDNKVPFLCTFDKRDTFSFAQLNIKIDDLIILHKDLLKLEQETLNNEPIEDKSKFEARRGVSHKKVLAQSLAKHIADDCWQQDTENKIKVGEMCDIVWSKIIDSGLGKELPDHRENIKPWIKEVTPAYASEAGRPPL
ncbi:hypothetical protein [Psychrobacter alimentarius]|uniref:hypothetical protein n=1 Tax=Psychrobacter alimentarius TaxID=261164 RepID=UPI0019199BA8|nr:hypothetical protein [Psychrobacter alimentarius]